MKPRFALRQLFGCIGILGMLLAIGMYVLPNEISRAEVNKLKRGMTRDQVHAVLGRPDGISETWGEDGLPRECWRYGIYGWEVFFNEGCFEEAEPF